MIVRFPVGILPPKFGVDFVTLEIEKYLSFFLLALRKKEAAVVGDDRGPYPKKYGRKQIKNAQYKCMSDYANISKISKRELNFSKILVTRMRTIYEYYRH